MVQHVGSWLLGMLIEHDAYYAGEINRTRALRRQTDVWEHGPAPTS
jgi:hypothetical protein